MLINSGNTVARANQPAVQAELMRALAEPTTSVTDLGVGRAARPRPVQVDDMEPARPRPGESVGDGGRVVVVGGLPLEGALPEPDHAPIAQVDRGDHLEHACHRHRIMIAY